MFQQLLTALMLAVILLAGCEIMPRKYEQPRFYNPFPQLHKIAVLPFFNQSAEPTLSGREVAEHYRGELQKIPGFEVLPVGVVERYLEANPIPLGGKTDFQQIARDLNVDAVVVGSVTDFTPYYPPRNWLGSQLVRRQSLFTSNSSRLRFAVGNCRRIRNSPRVETASRICVGQGSIEIGNSATN